MDDTGPVWDAPENDYAEYPSHRAMKRATAETGVPRRFTPADVERLTRDEWAQRGHDLLRALGTTDAEFEAFMEIQRRALDGAA